MPHVPIIVDGEEWPSVTDILKVKHKEYLVRWRGRVGNVEADRKMKWAADIGTAVHDEIEQYLRDGTEGESRLFAAWKRWAEKHEFGAIELERTVKSYAYQYGGTFDAIGVMDGILNPIVFDWKTSSRLDPDEYSLQLAAYAQAYFEETGSRVERGCIVRMDKKTARVEHQLFKNLEAEFEDFKHYLAIYNRSKRFERGKNGL